MASRISNLDTSPARLGAVVRPTALWTGGVYWPSLWLWESPDISFGVLGRVFDGIRRGAGLSGEF